MKLNGYKESYEYYSEKASDVVRQLSFAGIAIIWIFKIQFKGIPIIPDKLQIPLGLFCLSLALDLIHYFLGYITWYAVYKYHEQKRTDENIDLKHSKILPIPLHICMIGKIMAVIIAYLLLIAYVFSIWSQNLSS